MVYDHAIFINSTKNNLPFITTAHGVGISLSLLALVTDLVLPGEGIFESFFAPFGDI